jgi:hypothetical protein
MDALRSNPEFQAHFARMFTPLRLGFARVCSVDYVTGAQEREILDEVYMGPELRERARVDALAGIRSFEALVVDTLEKSVWEFMKQPDMYGGQTLSWNATNAEEMETNMSCFLDSNVEIWKDNEFADYKESLRSDPTLTAEERDSLCFYVREFVEYASVYLPHAVGEEADEVYYDSASTEAG